MTLRIAVVQFPGSNCEREAMLAVKRAGMEPIEFLWNESREKLADMHGFIIVGGFSYEDRSRAGIIAALDPVMQAIRIQSERGKPVLGICNGAQILVETGLVPGLENNKVGMVLAENKRMQDGKIIGTGYYNTWVYLRLSPDYQRNAFTRHLTRDDILHVPIAHAEGRFVMSDALLQEIKAQGQAIFQYGDATGNVIDQFPINPNGSICNIAGVSNKAGNVMALMPHPERTLNGDPIFQSMRDYITENQFQPTIPLHYYPRRTAITSYQKPAHAHECMIELIITDNHALTVQNTLQQLGLRVTVKRRVHWEIDCDSIDVLQQIKKSGVLFNDRKECEVAPRSSTTTTTFLVRPKEDLLGRQKLQTLKDHFHINNVNAMTHSIMWEFISTDAAVNAQQLNELAEKILATNVISNAYAHDCYRYE